MEIDRFLIFVYLPHGFSVWHPHFVLSIQSIFSILDIYQADDLAISRLLDSLIVRFVLLLKSRVAIFFFSSKCSWWAWYRFLYIILKREDAPQVYAGTSFGLRRHEHPPGVPADPGVERRMHRRQCVCSLHASCNDSIHTHISHISNIDSHNKNVAILSICGGISGNITKCQGNPTSTTGESGDAKFSLTPTDAGATINISKGRWEQCIKSAEATCPDGQAYTATCPLGASTGDIDFELTKQ